MKEWGVLVRRWMGNVNRWNCSCASLKIWRSDDWGQLVEYPVNFLVVIIILIGTIAFILFLSSMKYITAVETSILSSIEPLTALIISVIWLGQVLGLWQYVGVIVMLLFVTWLSIAGQGKRGVV